MDKFPGQITEVSARDAGAVKKLDIDLSIALTDQLYGISGNYFYIWSAPAGTYIDIRINETREPAISFVEQTGLKTPFDALYITTPAGQVGTVILLYGTEAPEFLQVIDNRSAQASGLDAVRDELRGDTTPENWGTEETVGNAAAVSIIAANANRKGCIIQAKSTNTGIVYLGFDNTVTTTKWIAELQPGQAFTVDDYRGDLYAKADAAGQLVGWGEW